MAQFIKFNTYLAVLMYENRRSIKNNAEGLAALYDTRIASRDAVPYQAELLGRKEVTKNTYLEAKRAGNNFAEALLLLAPLEVQKDISRQKHIYAGFYRCTRGDAATHFFQSGTGELPRGSEALLTLIRGHCFEGALRVFAHGRAGRVPFVDLLDAFSFIDDAPNVVRYLLIPITIYDELEAYRNLEVEDGEQIHHDHSRLYCSARRAAAKAPNAEAVCQLVDLFSPIREVGVGQVVETIMRPLLQLIAILKGEDENTPLAVAVRNIVPEGEVRERCLECAETKVRLYGGAIQRRLAGSELEAELYRQADGQRRCGP